jgi:hypothetical protein
MKISPDFGPRASHSWRCSNNLNKTIATAILTNDVTDSVSTPAAMDDIDFGIIVAFGSPVDTGSVTEQAVNQPKLVFQN